MTAYIISKHTFVQSLFQKKNTDTLVLSESTDITDMKDEVVTPAKASSTLTQEKKEEMTKKPSARVSPTADSPDKSQVAGRSTRNMSGFVKRNGRQLTINGAVFKSIGVNRYNLLTIGGTPYIGCAGVFSESDLASWFSEIDTMGVTSVRLWVFQSFTKGGTDFSRFDQILSLANSHGIKVIPVLENQWADCTEGGYKSTEWYTNGYKNLYGSYALSYKDYVGKVVEKYKDNSTIMLWQLINEAETDHHALYAFAQDMSSYIKSLDTNHLVSLGTIGSGQKGAQESQYRTLHAIPTIDVVEYHDYHYDKLAFPDYDNFNSLKVRFSDAITLDKPIIMGEAGIKANCGEANCYSVEQRAEFFRAKMEAFFNRGGAAYLLWSYRDHMGAGAGDNFNFSATDPLVGVISSQVAKL